MFVVAVCARYGNVGGGWVDRRLGSVSLGFIEGAFCVGIFPCFYAIGC